MNALGDIVARERRSGDAALVAPRQNRAYDYRRFCTTAWKTGNFFRRLGVHGDSTVAVAADPAPEALFSFFGAALLGARTEFGLATGTEPRVAVAPRDRIGDYDLPAGGQRVAYADPPEDPSTHHFERDVWSENPAFPETAVAPETAALVAHDERGGESQTADRESQTADRTVSHADLLRTAREVAADWNLGPGDEVAVRASLADAGAVVAGIVAPLLAGAAVVLPDASATGTAAVVGDDADAPESRTVAASAVRRTVVGLTET